MARYAGKRYQFAGKWYCILPEAKIDRNIFLPAKCVFKKSPQFPTGYIFHFGVRADILQFIFEMNYKEATL